MGLAGWRRGGRGRGGGWLGRWGLLGFLILALTTREGVGNSFEDGSNCFDGEEAVFRIRKLEKMGVTDIVLRAPKTDQAAKEAAGSPNCTSGMCHWQIKVLPWKLEIM
jgi:hypothetical protein